MALYHSRYDYSFVTICIPYRIADHRKEGACNIVPSERGVSFPHNSNTASSVLYVSPLVATDPKFPDKELPLAQ